MQRRGAGTERGGMGDANERGKFLRKGVDMGADRRDPVGGKGFGDELQLRGVSQIWGLTSPAQAKAWFVSERFTRLCRGRCKPLSWDAPAIAVPVAERAGAWYNSARN